MNVVASSSGDVLHHHHGLNVSVGGTDEEEGELDSTVSPDEDGRTRRRPTRGQSRIEFERLAAFFHVPINEAAKGLGVCATVLKKVCRKHGIPRWPHRKIKKLDTMLAMLETAANKPGNPQHDDDVRKKMDAVMRDRMVLMTEGKLIGEGKTERRSKSDGKRDRKRKKPDDDDEEQDLDHDDVHDHPTNSYAVTQHNNEQELLQVSSQVLMAPNMPSHISHLSTMDMNGLNGYHVLSGYGNGYGGLGGYTNPTGMGMNGVNGLMLGGGMGGGPSYAFNSLFWNAMGGTSSMGMNSNISLPSVHSISSGVISSTTGMMMNNLPPLPHTSLSATLPLSPTPLSPAPLTPTLTPTLSPPSLSNSNPLPLHSSHKHPKLSHNEPMDHILSSHNHHNHHNGHHHNGHHNNHNSHSHNNHHHNNHHYQHHHNIGYSDFSVHDPPSETSHFRLLGVDIPIHQTASE